MQTMYVLSNGDLFREGLNALVTFLGEDAFQTVTRIGIVFALYGVIMMIVKHQDYTEFFRWFFLLVIVTSVLVAPKTKLAIYDTSQPASVLKVNNVPVSLAVAVSIFTTVSYGVTNAMETAFHLPGDLSYNTTGMLFDAKMFEAAHSFRILNPELHSEMDDYIQNCVLGDIRINKKYTMAELMADENLASRYSKNPSPVRRIAFNGLKTCQEVTPLLIQAMQNEITNQSMVSYGKKLFGVKEDNNKQDEQSYYSALFEKYLTPSYDGLINDSSATATSIFMQAMLVNALSEGIRDYAAMSDAGAGLQNYVTTKATLQSQETWVTIGIEASYFLPIIQTILLLILVCLFPFVAVLSLMPNGFSQWGNYLRSFVYLGLWPPLFAIVNMAMNYYLEAHTSAFTGISMNTFDQLAAVCANTSAIAGYLSICVPFLAMGLVTNQVLHAIANPVSGIFGGMQHGISMATAESASGNMSVGNVSNRNMNSHNVSENNTNANKHDTDTTYFSGTTTEQLASGVTKTTTEDGNTVYNVAPGMSNLAQSINLSEQLINTLSHSSEQARAMAATEANNVQSSVSSAASHFVQLGEALGKDHRENDHVSLGLSDTETKALSFLDSKADEIAKNEHISKADAFKELGNMAYHGQIGANVDAKNGLVGMAAKHTIGTGGSVNVSAGYTKSDASEHTDSYTRNDTHGLTSREAEEVSQAFHVMESHQHNQSSDVSDSRAKTLIENFASDLHSARTSSHNRDVSYSQSERLSDMATQAQTNSASVNSNLNQAFVNYVRESEGEAKADALFSNPGALSSQAQLSALGSRFVNHVAQDMMQDNTAGFEARVNPEASFAHQSAAQGGAESILKENNTANHDILRHKAEFQTTNGVENEIRGNVNTHLNQSQENTTNAINQHWQAHQSEKKAMETDLEKGKHTATTWTTPIVGGWIPTDGRSNEEKLDNETKQ